MRYSTCMFNAEYPVYGAKFLDNNVLLIAGGGGEGKNGIPNKITSLNVSYVPQNANDKSIKISKLTEFELDDQDDSPTALDAQNGIALVGCNENSEKISSGKGNKHIRKFEVNAVNDKKIYGLEFSESIDFDKSKDPNEYTKLINISRDGSLSAIASSSEPTVLRIINPTDMSEKYEIESPNEIKDLHFSPNGKVISYITRNSLEMISTVTGSCISRIVKFDSNWNLSKIRFVDNDNIIIAASLIRGSGIVLIQISSKSGKATIGFSKLISKKFKGVTSMDVDVKGQLGVISTNDNSLILVKLKNLQIGKVFNEVHSFAVTRVAISPDSQFVASVSAANTVHIVSLPEDYSISLSASEVLYNIFVRFILVILIAICLQYAYQRNLHSKIGKYVLKLTDKRYRGNKANYFEQTTLIGSHTETMQEIYTQKE